MWFWNLLGWVLGISVFALLLLSFLSWLSSKASKKEKNENKKEKPELGIDINKIINNIIALVMLGVLIWGRFFE